jgi:class 3 adenylate cyclase/tetratricopeptide (TPR) repeat protein
MKCPRCNTQLAPGAAVCLHCGLTDLEAVRSNCDGCQTPLVSGAAYCFVCGKPVDPATPDRNREATDPAATIFEKLGPRRYVEQLASGHREPAERRIVTTLFVDIVNSVGLADRLDPEIVMDVINAAFEVFVKPVRRQDGTLARLMGDGVLCLFGAPTAHEDDASRACRAALEIIENVAEFRHSIIEQYGLTSFNVRIGLSTGLVVVGEVGTAERAEYTAIGDAVNMASRLQHAAKPGTALVCAETARQAGERFALEDLGAIDIRGKSEPVRAYRLFSASPSEYESNRVRPRLVGRDAELKEIEQSLMQLQAGCGSILAVSGEAGLGKSRLLEEARRKTKKEILWAKGRCAAHTEDMSYHAARSLLLDLLGGELFDEPEILGQTLRRSVRSMAWPNESSGDQAVGAHAPDKPTVVCASLGHLLHVPLSEKENEFTSSLQGEAMRQHIELAFHDFLQRHAENKPLVVVWEDIQWLDPQSAQLLETIVELTTTLPLSIIITHTGVSNTVAPILQKLEKESARPLIEIQLSHLGERNCTELLQSLLQVESVPQNLVRSVMDVARGNVFFLTEIVRGLRDSAGTTIAGAGASSLSRLDTMKMPQSIRGAILSRVDSLSTSDKRTLQMASVLDRFIHVDVLTRMHEDGRSKEGIARSLELLHRREFIEPVSSPENSSTEMLVPRQSGMLRLSEMKMESGEFRPDLNSGANEGQFRFVHALTQEVVYDSLLRMERKRLHLLAGQAIEVLFPNGIESLVPILALHFERAGQVEKAVNYLRVTADQATRVFALNCARRYYTRALAFCGDNADGRDAIGCRKNLHEGLGDVHYLMSDYPVALEQYDRVLKLDSTSDQRARLYRKRGRLFEKWGRYNAARESFEAGLEALNGNPDGLEAGRIYVGLGLTYYHDGELDQASELAHRALDIMQKIEDQPGIAQANNNLAVIAAKKGNFKQARDHYDACLQIWAQTRDTYGLASCHNNMGRLAIERKNWENATDHFEQSLALFKRLNNRHGVARVYDNLSQAYYLRGDRAMAEKFLEKGLSIMADIGADASGLMPEMWQSGVW